MDAVTIQQKVQELVKAKHARGEPLNKVEQRVWDEEISPGLSPRAAEPRRKHLMMAALFMLGASYSQLMYVFTASKGSVHEALARQLPPAIRSIRPKASNKPMLTWEQFMRYYNLALQTAGVDAIRLAAAVKKAAGEALPDSVDTASDEPY